MPEARPNVELSDDVRRVLSAWGSIGAHEKWANCADRSAETAPARAAADQRFLDQAEGDPVRAVHFRKAFYKRLALKSAQARARRKAVRRGMGTGDAA
jgi:hypothetical protein